MLVLTEHRHALGDMIVALRLRRASGYRSIIVTVHHSKYKFDARLKSIRKFLRQLNIFQNAVRNYPHPQPTLQRHCCAIEFKPYEIHDLHLDPADRARCYQPK